MIHFNLLTSSYCTALRRGWAVQKFLTIKKKNMETIKNYFMQIYCDVCGLILSGNGSCTNWLCKSNSRKKCQK